MLERGRTNSTVPTGKDGSKTLNVRVFSTSHIRRIRTINKVDVVNVLFYSSHLEYEVRIWSLLLASLEASCEEETDMMLESS